MNVMMVVHSNNFLLVKVIYTIVYSNYHIFNSMAKIMPKSHA